LGIVIRSCMNTNSLPRVYAAGPGLAAKSGLLPPANSSSSRLEVSGRPGGRARMGRTTHHFDAIKAATHWANCSQELARGILRKNGCGPSEDRRNRPVIMAEDRCNQRLKSLIFCRRGCKKGCGLAPVEHKRSGRGRPATRRRHRTRRAAADATGEIRAGRGGPTSGWSRSSLAAGPRRRGPYLQTPHTTTEARTARPHAGRRRRDARGGRRHPVQAHLPHRAAGAAAVQLWSGRGRGGQ